MAVHVSTSKTSELMAVRASTSNVPELTAQQTSTSKTFIRTVSYGTVVTLINILLKILTQPRPGDSGEKKMIDSLN